MAFFAKHFLVAMAAIALAGKAAFAGAATVLTMRVPDHGVQPQAVTTEKNIVHVIYLAGDPAHSDIFCITSDDGRTFSKPVRVNSQPGAAIALGTVRGAHLAVGKAGRLHVAWMGSTQAEPKAAGNVAPMLYARSAEDRAGFEPQRNVIQSHTGLDGGGSIAADDRGNVYIAWHAPQVAGEGEQSRKVWLVQSHDSGATFSPEEAISGEAGSCGCCGMRLLAAHGSIFALYRTADHKLQRDMTLLRINLAANQRTADVVGQMQSAACVMSTAALVPDRRQGVIGAWETGGQIYWSRFGAAGAAGPAVPTPGRSSTRKHPALAVNSAGQFLVAWTDGTGWNRGGSVAWQVYDAAGNPLPDCSGQAQGLPAWGAVSAFARADGTFVVVY